MGNHGGPLVFNEILSSDITVPGESDFEVGTGADEVSVTSPSAAGLVFANGNSCDLFEDGDSVLLTGAFINIPYGFGQGTGRALIGIAWKDLSDNYHIIPELAGNSILAFPNFCELEFPPSGLFIKAPVGFGKVALYLTNIVMNVSQINFPTDLGGDVLKVQFHLRVNHTKLMVNEG